jgi:two-component system OmpR family response regulator
VSQTIVVVDDEPTLRNRLRKYLQSEGFTVYEAEGGAVLRDLLDRVRVDLVVLDLMLPGEDGLSITRELRARTSIGILILTGKGDAVDRIVGLEMGADDYLAKPFELRELLARVRSILRRVTAPPPPAPGPAAAIPPDTDTNGSERVHFDRWSLDLRKMELRGDGGETIHLTGAEFRILRKFVENPGRTLNRDQLMDAMAEREWTPFDRSIDLHISNLRKKIESDPKNPGLIKTVRSFGYVFTPSVDPA